MFSWSWIEILCWYVKHVVKDNVFFLTQQRFLLAWKNLLMRSSFMPQSNCMFNQHWCLRERVSRRLVTSCTPIVSYLLLFAFYFDYGLICWCIFILNLIPKSCRGRYSCVLCSIMNGKDLKMKRGCTKSQLPELPIFYVIFFDKELY